MRPHIAMFAALVLSAVTCGTLRAEVIAEYTGSPTTTGLVVSSQHTQAMAFDVSGAPTVTEIQLRLRRWTGSTGYLAMELRPDDNGKPASGLVAILSRPAVEVQKGGMQWFSFRWFGGGGSTLYAGRWWIVLKVNTSSDAEIDWEGVSGNPYGDGGDTKHSSDGGSTWPVIQGMDCYFRVFGNRTLEPTTVTLTATPATVATAGTSSVQVTVKDSGGVPVAGPGTVTLACTGGSLAHTTLTLSNGQRATTWTAPASVGSHTVTATYAGHSFAGIDYQPGNAQTSVNIVAQQRGTTTTLTLNPTSTTTRSSITASTTVRDALNNLVPGGTVTFSSSVGTLGSTTVAVVNGQASTTWTASNATGSVAIDADFSGYDNTGGGGIVYGASGDSKNVTVDYTNIATTTTVRVSPAYPYKGKTTYVMVEVKAGGTAVPGGSVQLLANPTGGTFQSASVALAGGKGHTVWTAPTSAGDVVITGQYQQRLAGGNRYTTSSGNDTAHVVADSDSDGTDLTWISEWISDYSDNPLPNSKAQSQGFTNKLTNAIGWTGNEYSNKSAREHHWAKSSQGGGENSYVDAHDFAWYNGHGNPDYFTFTYYYNWLTYFDDTKLKHSEAYDAWGTKDLEWIAFKTCKVMSHDSYWASTMNGVHLECGFHTNAESREHFGEIFAAMMIKESVNDEPHPIHQSWFLAGDMTHRADKRQRVIGETNAMFSDYLWGQGYVSADPAVDDYYSARSHDVIRSWPSADAGGPYNAAAGVSIQLDASGTLDPDEQEYLYFAWDLDPSTNTDDGDYDNDDTDEANDDADIWGRRPWVKFDTAGSYNIRLNVLDDAWKTDDDTATVVVTAPAPAPGESGLRSILRNALTNGEVEIVDNFPTLPPETQMPLLLVFGTALGLNEMMSIAGYFGMGGSSTLDSVGNWNMADGGRDLIVNQHSGSVMYIDRDRAYLYTGPPSSLPTDPQAMQIADAFLNANGIQRMGWVYDGVSDMYAEDTDKNGRARITSIPFQRRVNYARTVNVGPQAYPVVGPGGKITVMLDQTGDPVMLVKVWREADATGPDLQLHPAALAIQDFHRLGIKALLNGCWVPPCNRIEIDNVSLGYFEEDFVTPQTTLYPVYILDLTCEDDRGAQRVQVYLPAIAPPLDANITAPTDEYQVVDGTPIAFAGSCVGGVPPYTYAWSSDMDGPLGTGTNVQATLRLHMESGELFPHTVALRVTDQTNNATEVRVTVHVRPIPGDLDGDGDKDLDDHALLADCLTGPDVSSSGPACPPTQFMLSDLDGDDDVDLADFKIMQAVFAGPGACGNGWIESGEQCDDAGASINCDADCTAAVCGDGTVNTAAGEECDDAGESATCDANCTAVLCGDGTVNRTAGEDCDDGGESATCDADCTFTTCGDGTLNLTAGEACDDGGASATCDIDCTAAVCGDGTVNFAANEACDDGGESAICDVNCTIAMCGDGTTNVTSGEECDDGGESATCDADCTAAVCGDGTTNVTFGEECDDGGESATCDADCTAAVCGDGTLNVTAGEECDDNNTTGGDGCSAQCQIESQGLPDCIIDFDVAPCPNLDVVCGAFFDGGLGCEGSGAPTCFNTPPFGYQLASGPPLLINLEGDLNKLSLYFAGMSGSGGEMQFFDIDGDPVDAPVLTNGDCVSMDPPPEPQLVNFTRPVRSIVVNATGGTVWIDTFHVNPP